MDFFLLVDLILYFLIISHSYRLKRIILFWCLYITNRNST